MPGGRQTHCRPPLFLRLTIWLKALSTSNIIDRLLEPKEESRSPFYSLFEALRFEMSQGIVFDGIANLKRVTAHLAVFDIGMTSNREVQDHRYLFATEGTDEGMFHDTSTVPQISIV